MVESLPIYTDSRIVTVAELSGWRSPPRLPPSAQTQTGPGQREEGGAGGAGRVEWGTKHNSQMVDWSKFCAEKQQTDTVPAVTVPWCEPSLVSGPGCAQEWQRCRSP